MRMPKTMPRSMLLKLPRFLRSYPLIRDSATQRAFEARHFAQRAAAAAACVEVQVVFAKAQSASIESQDLDAKPTDEVVKSQLLVLEQEAAAALAAITGPNGAGLGPSLLGRVMRPGGAASAPSPTAPGPLGPTHPPTALHCTDNILRRLLVTDNYDSVSILLCFV